MKLLEEALRHLLVLSMIIHDYGTDTTSPSPDPNPPSNPNFNGMSN